MVAEGTPSAPTDSPSKEKTSVKRKVAGLDSNEKGGAVIPMKATSLPSSAKKMKKEKTGLAPVLTAKSLVERKRFSGAGVCVFKGEGCRL